MTADTDAHAITVIRRVGDGVRVLIVGGVPAGVVLVGLGSRVAMFVLRLTSPDRVRGITSDDGFTIGEVTLGGTYNLLALGAATGVIGAGAYLMVSRWLIGPIWFRRITTGLASAVVVGSMLVHPDGIDFTALRPVWLAIGLFVLLPGLFGTFIGSAVDAVKRPGSWTARARWRWILPVALLVCFPVLLPLVAVATLVLGIWAIASDLHLVQRVRTTVGFGLVMRCAWLSIAVLGLVALVDDISALT